MAQQLLIIILYMVMVDPFLFTQNIGEQIKT